MTRPGPEAVAVSVVVPTYRRPQVLPELFAALAAQEVEGGFEVVVVDNGSGDDTGRVLAELAAVAPMPVTVLAIATNRGPAAARNLGWRTARAPIVAFTDDDCRPAPGWLAAGVAAMAADPDLGVVQGAVDRPPDSTLGAWTVWRHITGPTPYFEACNVFYRRAALERTRGFDEQIGWYGEDSAAGWAVLEAGWRRGFAAAAFVEHDVEERGVRWHVRNGLLERNVVGVAARFPGFRAEAFWRPWAFRRQNAAITAAVAGLALATRWRPAALLALPYLWWRRPPRGVAQPARYFAECVAVDLAQAAGLAAGSVRHGILVL